MYTYVYIRCSYVCAEYQTVDVSPAIAAVVTGGGVIVVIATVRMCEIYRRR